MYLPIDDTHQCVPIDTHQCVPIDTHQCEPIDALCIEAQFA